MITQNLPEYWESKYQDQDDSWELGHATPPLIRFFDHPLCPKEGRVLVPGAGKGHDAAEWAKRGYETVAVDFAQSAFESLSRYAEMYHNLSIMKMDIFDLSPRSTELFDIVFEYTCFCAIHPGRRDEYFEIWHKMIKPNGVVIALFFPIIPHTNLDGPPHPTSEGELMARLDGVFHVEARIPALGSVKNRVGKEEFWILKKIENGF